MSDETTTKPDEETKPKPAAKKPAAKKPAAKKPAAKKPAGPLHVDDPIAGTIDDPNVVDPYAHLRSDEGASDKYAPEDAPAAQTAAQGDDEA